jgi:hypothetical protein
MKQESGELQLDDEKTLDVYRLDHIQELLNHTDIESSRTYNWYLHRCPQQTSNKRAESMTEEQFLDDLVQRVVGKSNPLIVAKRRKLKCDLA